MTTTDASEIRGCVTALRAAAGGDEMPLDALKLARCIDVFSANETRNANLQDIYEGNTTLHYLPDFVPRKYLQHLKVGCPWPEIAVQSVVERSQFDGFVFDDDTSQAATMLKNVSERCDIAGGYQIALTDSLVHGVAFAVAARDEEGPCLRWHTATSAAGFWHYGKQRLDCGFAIVDRMRRNAASTGDDYTDTVPSKVDFYVDGGVWEFTREPYTTWSAEYVPDPLGRPRIEALVFRPDGRHPLGRSRITRPMRAIAQEYMANALNIHVASEYTAIGQKWVTGLSDDQLAKFAENKWKFAADSAVLTTDNPETGTNPQFGTFAQQSMEPLLSVKRSLATDFAAASSIPISELLTQDSNPTSAEALVAAKDKLISLVESVNTRNKRTLCTLARMLIAIDRDVALADLTDEERAVTAHFREPATPSAAAMADSALKISQTVEGYGGTSVCLERLGFDDDERNRIMAEVATGKTVALLNQIADNAAANSTGNPTGNAEGNAEDDSTGDE